MVSANSGKEQAFSKLKQAIMKLRGSADVALGTDEIMAMTRE